MHTSHWCSHTPFKTLIVLRQIAQQTKSPDNAKLYSAAQVSEYLVYSQFDYFRLSINTHVLGF